MADRIRSWFEVIDAVTVSYFVAALAVALARAIAPEARFAAWPGFVLGLPITVLIFVAIGHFLYPASRSRSRDRTPR